METAAGLYIVYWSLYNYWITSNVSYTIKNSSIARILFQGLSGGGHSPIECFNRAESYLFIAHGPAPGELVTCQCIMAPSACLPQEKPHIYLSSSLDLRAKILSCTRTRGLQCVFLSIPSLQSESDHAATPHHLPEAHRPSIYRCVLRSSICAPFAHSISSLALSPFQLLEMNCVTLEAFSNQSNQAITYLYPSSTRQTLDGN